jgi:hypothetical protein
VALCCTVGTNKATTNRFTVTTSHFYRQSLTTLSWTPRTKLKFAIYQTPHTNWV